MIQIGAIGRLDYSLLVAAYIGGSANRAQNAMSLSAHMVDSFERKPSYAPYTSSRPPRPTMPQTPFTPFGADQSFAGDSWIEGHGYPPPRPSGSVGGFSRWSEEKVAALQMRLAKKLGPEFVTQRPGPGGGPKLR